MRTRPRKVCEEALDWRWEGDSVPITIVVHGATCQGTRQTFNECAGGEGGGQQLNHQRIMEQARHDALS